MNVGEMLRERDRLLAVLEEGKSARVKLKQLNVLIALYGTEDVEAVTNGHAAGPAHVCEECGAGFFVERGLSTHRRRMHGTESPKTRSAQAAKAAAARKAKK